MLMLIDTPDPRYGGDPGRDGPGRPHLGARTVALLGGCAICLYLARFVPGFVEVLLLAAAFAGLLAAIFSLWSLGDGPPAEEPGAMFLMLVDTRDPRYRREPDPEPEPEREPWRRRHPRARLVLPWVGCFLCFGVAYLVPPFVTFVLTTAALMLFFDGALALLPTGDGLWSNRQ